MNDVLGGHNIGKILILFLHTQYTERRKRFKVANILNDWFLHHFYSEILLLFRLPNSINHNFKPSTRDLHLFEFNLYFSYT